PGRSTRYHYDGVDPDSGEPDPANPHAVGRLSTIVHPGGERDTFLYDRLGRVVETRRTIPALGETFVSRTDHGLDGTVLGHTYPDGYHVAYEYDEHHRPPPVRGRQAGGPQPVLLPAAVHPEL